MVINKYFQDISIENNKVLSLPPFKQKSLTIEYEKLKFQNSNVTFKSQEPKLPFAVSKIYEVDISASRRLSAIDITCKSIYEITLNIQNHGYTYKPGDTIGVIPSNNKIEVATIINQLGLDNVADFSYILSVDSNLKGAKIPAHIPVKSSIRNTLTHYVDIRGLLKKAFILSLSLYTKEESERKILEYLCSKEGSLIYNSHVLSKNLCILDLLHIFKSCKPPIEIIFEHLPRLLPRPYSVCSSNLKDPGKLKICFSVKDIGNERKGLTTGWLEEFIVKIDDIDLSMKELNLTNERRIPIYFRNNISKFRMPDDLSIPIILIGHGTGIAPFLGFLEEREYVINKNFDIKLGFTWLFNGCRHPKLDFIYETELNSFIQHNILNKMSTAFSKLDNCYVQDILEQNGEQLTNLIVTGASIFICGDVNTMVKDVRAAIIRCIQKYTCRNVEEATEYVSGMEKEKRYLVDVWN